MNLPSSSSPTRNSSNRFLWRGALSLPDSHLVLDGLTFTARVDDGNGNRLLDNPLALALETMRGRPTLRLMGTVGMKDIYTDCCGDITVDVHPLATLSRIYFENIFCLKPLDDNKVGVRIALGDTDGPEITQSVVFAQLDSHPPSGTKVPQTVSLVVARIVLSPPPAPASRLPRPDDPTPRKPPPHLLAKVRELRRIGSSNIILPSKKKRKLEDGLVAGLGSHARIPSRGVDDDVFKVPLLPSNKGKEKAFDVDIQDVFCDGPKTATKRKREESQPFRESQETQGSP